MPMHLAWQNKEVGLNQGERHGSGDHVHVELKGGPRKNDNHDFEGDRVRNSDKFCKVKDSRQPSRKRASAAEKCPENECQRW